MSEHPPGADLPPQDVWQFPCRMDMKTVLEQRSDAADAVVAAIQSVIPGDYAPRLRPSSAGHYVSVTVGVNFQSKAELQAVYAALKALPGVRMVL